MNSVGHSVPPGYRTAGWQDARLLRIAPASWPAAVVQLVQSPAQRRHDRCALRMPRLIGVLEEVAHKLQCTRAHGWRRQRRETRLRCSSRVRPCPHVGGEGAGVAVLQQLLVRDYQEDLIARSEHALGVARHTDTIDKGAVDGGVLDKDARPCARRRIAAVEHEGRVCAGDPEVIREALLTLAVAPKAKALLMVQREPERRVARVERCELALAGGGQGR
eukprot:5313601-Prymnesium_polylepis.1